MSRPRLLDLFSGAGGAAVGYHRAGFDVTGVDIKHQPRFPFDFVQADALEYLAEHGHEFDAIHASPPCQAYSTLKALTPDNEYPELVAPTRELLEKTGTPWVIENVPGAPLNGVILLCGSMFGLDVRRHRWFESNVILFALACQHQTQTPRFRSLDKRRVGQLASVVGVHGHINYSGEFEIRCKAMGIDWMSAHELTQSIPPAYTEFIGRQLLAALEVKAA